MYVMNSIAIYLLTSICFSVCTTILKFLCCTLFCRIIVHKFKATFLICIIFLFNVYGKTSLCKGKSHSKCMRGGWEDQGIERLTLAAHLTHGTQNSASSICRLVKFCLCLYLLLLLDLCLLFTWIRFSASFSYRIDEYILKTSVLFFHILWQ